MKTLSYRLEIKSITDEGTFEGDLSVYRIKDLGGDVVEPGAYTKTLKDNGGRVPLLWQHDDTQPIGYLELTDSDRSLKAKGTLILSVARAREAYDLLKAGVLKGLSIGYETIKDEVKGNVRYLKELRLWEGSVVTFPMLPDAQITSVKAGRRLSATTLDALDKTLTALSMAHESLTTLRAEAGASVEDEAVTETDEPSLETLAELEKLSEMLGDGNVSTE